MMTLTLLRHTCTADYTLGDLLDYRGGKICSTLELPWRRNQRNVSRIPSGPTYRVNYLARSASGRYKDVYHVLDVPSRSGILFHAGNTTRDTRGCILPASAFVRCRTSGAMGIHSRKALRQIHAVTNRQDFDLIIQE